MIRLAVCLSFLLFATASAAAPQPPEFKKAYRTYLELMKQGKERDAIPHAKAALDIALKSDAFDDEARGRLAFNLGFVYLLDDQMTASAAAFSQALERLEKAGGNDELKADALLYRGMCYKNLFKYREARTDLNAALALLTGDDRNVKLVRADALENLAWVELMDRNYREGHRLAVEAHRIFSELLTENHPRTINSLIVLSVGHYVLDRRWEARDLLAKAIEQAEKAGLREDGEDAGAAPGKFSRRELARFHDNVASLYRHMDRKSDAAYHSGVAADLRKGVPPAAMRVIPLKRKPPSYPGSASVRGVTGWAIVEYTVRKDGTTADIRIVDAAPEGYFEKTTIRAVESWEFKPPMEDGKPADIRNVRTCIMFKFK